MQLFLRRCVIMRSSLDRRGCDALGRQKVPRFAEAGVMAVKGRYSGTKRDIRKWRMCLAAIVAREGKGKIGDLLTLHFERVPPTASIQTYSAMTAPRWGRSRYFLSYVLFSTKDCVCCKNRNSLRWQRSRRRRCRPEGNSQQVFRECYLEEVNSPL